MPTPYQLSLLRRTFAVLVAASTLGAISDAHAQGKVKLSGATGNECSYSSMSITPDGSVTVQCSGATTPPPPPPPPAGQTFSISPTSAITAPSTVAGLAVNRNNGTAGEYLVFYELSGSGCAATQPQPAVLHFPDGGPTSASFGVAVTDSGTCGVRLHVLTHVSGTSGATIWEGNNQATVTVGSAPPPIGIAGCPTGYTLPDDMVSSSLAGLGNPIFALQRSGQVISIPLPNLNGLNTGQITFGESPTAVTPQPVRVDISINKCPGLIDTTLTACNIVGSTNSSINSMTWFAKAYSIITDTTSANVRGYCWAGDTDQYYVNARWTYQVCPLGQQVCGFAIQYNQGGY